MNRRTMLLGLVLGAMTLPVSMAADKPDFSGSWKLNASKSEFGMMPAPEKMDRTIQHADPSLKITTASSGPQGESTTDLTYTTDGKESVNKVRGVEAKSIANWEGKQIVIKSKREVQGMEISLVESWSLADDGKSLTIATKVNTPQGDFDVKVVMDKQ